MACGRTDPLTVVVTERMDAAVSRIVGYAERLREADSIPGLSLVLVDRTSTLGVACLGSAQLESGSPLEPSHLMQIGSIGKSFTALVALQLRDEGRLELDQPITNYLPWFEVSTRFGPITTHHLLTHTSGLVDGSLGFIDARSEVWALRRTETAWPPGSAFHYSNVGYQAVGLVITAICGRPFREVVRDRVLAPLGMAASEPAFSADVRPRLATGYSPFFSDRPFRPGHRLAPATWFEEDRADGSICSTPEDMGASVRTILNRGATPEGRIVSEEGFHLMTQPHTRDAGGAYGYGIGISDDGPGLVLRHGGDMVGFSAHLVADVEAGVGAVAMANGPSNPRAITRYARQVLAAASVQRELPPMPEIEDRHAVADAAALAGIFTCDGEPLVFEAEGERLLLRVQEGWIPLEPVPSEGVSFFAGHPRFERALLEFDFVGGRTMAVVHGRRRYAAEGQDEPIWEPPPGWRAFEGLYRSNSPWRPSVRFVLRGERLWIVDPPSGEARPLRATGDRSFRLAEDPEPPETVVFGSVLDGRALSVEIEGLDHRRSFDPPSVWNEVAE